MVIISSKETWNLRCLKVANNSSEEESMIEPVKKLSYTADQNIRLLYRKNYKSLCQYAVKKIKDEKEGEDIVSDAFFQLMQQTGRPGIDEMKSQLYTVIDIKCREHIELQKFIAKGVSGFDVVTPADEEEIEAELTKLMYDELYKLPPKRKQIMIQLFMQGLTSQQVAARMKLNEQTVRNQKIRALKTLQEKIKNRFSRKEK